MKEFRIGINSDFALQRWTEPHEWMSMVHNDFELDCVEFSLSLLDAQMEEPSRLIYIQELNELCDTYSIQIYSTYVGNILNSLNGLLHADLGRRISAIKWYEQALDITAGLSAFSIGLNLGNFPEIILNNPQKMEYFRLFLIDSLAYISRIAYSAGLGAVMIEPIQLEMSKTDNNYINKILASECKKAASVPIQFIANSADDSFEIFIQEFKSDIGLFHIHLDPTLFIENNTSEKTIMYKKTLESYLTKIRKLKLTETNIMLRINPVLNIDSNTYKEAVKTAISFMKSI